MLEHHLQKQILQSLEAQPGARFAELRPKRVESNVFSYHLRQLLKQKLVIKNADNTYSLTSHGRFATINLTHTPHEILELAHSVLLLAVRTPENDWLLQKRLSPPLPYIYRFLNAEPNAHESITKTASRALENQAAIKDLQFSTRGSGYISIFRDDSLQSYTHFTLLEAVIEQTFPLANNLLAWHHQPTFESLDMFPSLKDLVVLCEQSDSHFFTELVYCS